jgi:hypothetical protein
LAEKTSSLQDPIKEEKQQLYYNGNIKTQQTNPWKYLSHVLAHIQDHSSTKIAELIPWNVKLE